MRAGVLYRDAMQFRTAVIWSVISLVVVGGLSAGCAPVRAWERGKMASPTMEQRFGEQGAKGAYRAKVLESKTGGGLPGEAPGGGCGCTQ
jgi:hypothetical protein